MVKDVSFLGMLDRLFTLMFVLQTHSVSHKEVLLIKDSFSFHKLIPKNIQMTTLYTNLLLYITFTVIIYVRQD